MIKTVYAWIIMKNIAFRLFVCLSLACISLPLVHAVTPEEAAAKEGQYVTVTGVVSGANKSKSGAIYLNFGGDFPNHIFSVFIHRANAEAFPEFEVMKGKTYAVTGTIQMRDGRANMEIKSPEQAVLVADAGTEKPAAGTEKPAVK